MKTLQEIKNNYAQEQGHEDWADLYRTAGYYDERVFFMHEDAVIILAEKAALEKAAENSWINGSEFSRCGCEIDTTSITNPENLIR